MEEYTKIFTEYMARKCNCGFDGLEHAVSTKFNEELKSIISYLIGITESGRIYNHHFDTTWREAQDELEQSIYKAEDQLLVELRHMRELKAKEPNNWQATHLKEMKDYLDLKNKQIP